MSDRSRIVFISFFIIVGVLLAFFISCERLEEKSVSVDTGLIDTLVIDAGHGGEDGGAITKDGIRESRINLEITKKMAGLCDFSGIPYILTRDSEDIDYPEELNTTRKRKIYDQNRRVDLVNELDNAVLISIHQNKFTSGKPRGPQVFYSDADGSKELAELIQLNMSTVLYPQNRRVAASVSDKIFLMKKVNCTAVLAECGFLSNPTEAAALGDGDYQNKVALCIISAYCKYSDNKQIS